MYKSPVYEGMGFEKLKDRLLAIGYPAEINEFKYDPAFPCRYDSLVNIGTLQIYWNCLCFYKNEDVLKKC